MSLVRVRIGSLIVGHTGGTTCCCRGFSAARKDSCQRLELMCPLTPRLRSTLVTGNAVQARMSVYVGEWCRKEEVGWRRKSEDVDKEQANEGDE